MLCGMAKHPEGRGIIQKINNLRNLHPQSAHRPKFERARHEKIFIKPNRHPLAPQKRTESTTLEKRCKVQGVCALSMCKGFLCTLPDDPALPWQISSLATPIEVSLSCR